MWVCFCLYVIPIICRYSHAVGVARTSTFLRVAGLKWAQCSKIQLKRCHYQATGRKEVGGVARRTECHAHSKCMTAQRCGLYYIASKKMSFFRIFLYTQNILNVRPSIVYVVFYGFCYVPSQLVLQALAIIYNYYVVDLYMLSVTHGHTVAIPQIENESTHL